ncbi:hypothetical protein ES703_68557 [subsurface metagenome]
MGIPLPSSSIVAEPSLLRETFIFLQYPTRASSTELSTTSDIKWCNPSFPVEPMYIEGLFLIPSNPSSTFI